MRGYKLTGKIIGNTKVYNYNYGNKLWAVVVTEESKKFIGLAKESDIISGNVTLNTLKRVSYNPFIHYHNGVTELVDRNGISFFINTVDFDKIKSVSWVCNTCTINKKKFIDIEGITWDEDNGVIRHLKLSDYTEVTLDYK